jgi:molecular chaperone HtpG
MPTLQQPEKRQRKVTGPFVIGKDVLELLSSAMYIDPLTIYREYIQNAADAIDQADSAGHYLKAVAPDIEVVLDPAQRIAKIRDNGIGIPEGSFVRTLTAIGGSRKRGTPARGFRGVGRLAGLGYCQTLVMRSKAKGDSSVSELHWDCKRLKELLRDARDASLADIIGEIVTLDTVSVQDPGAHFFEVELRDMIRHRNDVLLNEATVMDYLGQVGPVPFSPKFSRASRIQQFLGEFGTGKTYAVTINGQPVFRPHADSCEVRLRVETKFTDLETFQIPAVSDGIDAIGWILHSEYLGAIPEKPGIKGLRLRIGNMQIGDSRLFDSVFPEPRFNSWAVGECHIISNRLIPNGRRDDLEQNTHYANLVNNLIPRAKGIAKACRENSAKRARQTDANSIPAQNGGVNWVKAKEFFVQNGTKKLAREHRRSLKTIVRRYSATYTEIVSSITTPLAKKNGRS